MIRKSIILGLILFLLAFSFNLALAAKKRPPRSSGGGAPVRSYYTRGAHTAVRFRPDRRGLLINFSGFNQVASVTYSLTYNANGIPQGVSGTVTAATAGEQRELLFGTCSGGVCRYHTNITNARLIIDSKLYSGAIIRKPYRIKV
jgi:hypothetical protein